MPGRPGHDIESIKLTEIDALAARFILTDADSERTATTKVLAALADAGYKLTPPTDAERAAIAAHDAELDQRLKDMGFSP